MSRAEATRPGALEEALFVLVQGRPRALSGAVWREAVALPPVTPVPGAPAAIVGLCAVRGRVVPVIAPEELPLDDEPARRATPRAAASPLPMPGTRDGAARDLWTDRGLLVLGDVLGWRVAFRVDGIDDHVLMAPRLHVTQLFEALRGAGSMRVPGQPAPVRALSLLADDLLGLRALFLDNAAEHLSAADRAAAHLEQVPHDAAARADLLRRLHTLKGAAGSVGLDEVVGRVHRLEDRVLCLRADAVPASWGRVTTALQALRVLSTRVATARPGAGTQASDASHSHSPSGHTEETLPVRVGVDQVDSLLEAASQLVQDRTRIARRLPDLALAARELEHAEAWLSGSDDDPRRRTEARAELAAARQRLQATLSALGDDVESLTGTSRVFQDGLHAMRMTEASRLFSPVAAGARELARKLDRMVEIRTVGGATGIDKALAERLTEPLRGLLRNALAHGIEPAEAREVAGKPSVGLIELSARQRGDEILIEVADDGAGVDLEAVRAALGPGPRAPIDEREEARLLDAIFEPGVTTVAAASDLAGRGLGLDVVRQSVARLGGSISCASHPGQGTRFTIRLPLTAAVVRALLFKTGGHVYALPVDAVVEVVAHGATSLPAADLDVIAVGTGAGGGTVGGQVVLLEHEGTRFALRVDRVIGEREIVVKGLGPLLAGLTLWAGSTVSGAGKVQLLIDVAELCARRAPPSAPAPLPRARILVADGSPTTRAALCDLLRDAGHDVDEAGDGASALARLAAAAATASASADAPRLPALLVTDVDTPGLDGLTLLEGLRAVPGLAAFPVVVVGALGTGARQRAMALGAAAFLDKPIPPAHLLATIESLLQRSKR